MMGFDLSKFFIIKFNVSKLFMIGFDLSNLFIKIMLRHIKIINYRYDMSDVLK